MATPGNPPRQVFFAQRSHGQSQVEACGASSWYSKIETGCTGELQEPTSEGPAVGGPLLGALSDPRRWRRYVQCTPAGA